MNGIRRRSITPQPPGYDSIVDEDVVELSPEFFSAGRAGG